MTQNLIRFPRVTGRLLSGSLLLSSVLALCGCENSEPITTYTVPKHESLQSPEFLADYQRKHPKPERMIGLVLPRPANLWFFKLQGDLEAVAAREVPVRDFLHSLTFSAVDKPDWVLPAGWQQLPGNDMRFATLVLDGESKLELTVTKFPSRPDLPIADQVVMNINRWRGQLSLPSIDGDDLNQQSEQIPIAGGMGYLINIIGRPQPKPSAMPFAASQGTRTQGTKTEGGTERNPAAASEGPEIDKPEGWTEGPSVMFATLSLQATEGDSKVGITVTPARGDKLQNVNRWRGQVGLMPLTEAEFATTAKKVPVGSMTGDLYEMIEGDRAIFGVIIEDQGQMWFVKLNGDARLAERERGRFQEFLKSLRLKS